MGKLEEKMGREDSILGDWNAHSHAWNEGRDEDTRGKIMEEWMVETGWMIAEGNTGPT